MFCSWTLQGETFLVDQIAAEGQGSLAEAVIKANETPGRDAIQFEFSHASAVIQLNAEILVQDDLLIDGSGVSGLTIEVSEQVPARLFNVTGASLTIMDATLRRGKVRDGRGGAIFFEGTSGDEVLHLERTVVRENRVDSVGESEGLGGALYIRNGVLKAVESVFHENSARNRGGAIYIAPNSLNRSSDHSVSACTFRGNSAGHQGGALYVVDGSEEGVTIRVERSAFVENLVFGSRGQALSGGGGIYFGVNLRGGLQRLLCEVVQSQFLNNECPVAGIGGGMLIGSGAEDDRVELTVQDSSFIVNVASEDGGGIALYGSSRSSELPNSMALFSNCTFSLNSGGGFDPPSAASFGGAISAFNTDIELEHCTIVDNRGGGANSDRTGVVGGIHVADGDLDLVNSAIAGNQGTQGAGKNADELRWEAVARGEMSSNGGNLIQGSTIGVNLENSDLTGQDPQLLDLDRDGEVTVGASADRIVLGIHVPREGSPLIDAQATQLSKRGRDQLGTSRPQGKSSDIGAIELKEAGLDEPDSLVGVPNLSASVLSSSEVALNWTEVTSDISYQLELDINGNPTVIFEGTTQGFTHSGLAPETTYSYRVRAVNSFGPGEFSERVTVTTFALPPAVLVKELVAAAIDDRSIQLSWVVETEGHGREIGYRVSYFPSHDESMLESVVTTDTTLVIEGLEEGTEYGFEVSVDGEENPKFGSKLIKPTLARGPEIASFVADDPDDLDAVFSLDDTMVLSFDMPTDKGGPSGNDAVSRSDLELMFDFMPNLEFEFEGHWNEDGDQLVVTVIGAAPMPPLIGSQGVKVIGSLRNRSQTSASSRSQASLGGDWGMARPAADLGDTVKFTKLEGEALSSHELIVRWAVAEPSLVERYEVERVTDSGSFEVVYAGVGSEFKLGELSPSTEVVFRIRTVTKTGAVRRSEELVITTMEEVSFPDRNVLFTGSASSPNEILLIWNAPDSRPPSYQVELDVEGNPTVIYEGADSLFTHSGLAPGTVYTYHLRVSYFLGDEEVRGPLLIATPAEEPKVFVKQLVAEVLDDQSIRLNWVGEVGGEEKEIVYRVSYFPVHDDSAVVSKITNATTVVIKELAAETDYQIEVSVDGEDDPKLGSKLVRATLARGPEIASFVADDPDDLDAVFSLDDILVLSFDIPTDKGGHIGDDAVSRSDIELMSEFMPELDFEFEGHWSESGDQLAITVIGPATNPPVIGSQTVKAIGLLRNRPQTSASSQGHALLRGDWGVIPPANLGDAVKFTKLEGEALSDRELILRWAVAEPSLVESYEVERMTDSGSFEVVYSGVETEFKLGKLSPSTELVFRIRFVTKTGVVGGSEELVITTMEEDSFPDRFIQFTGIASSPNEIRLAWNAPDSRPPSYQVELDVEGNPTLIYEGGDSNFIHTGLAPGTAYAYQLRVSYFLGDEEVRGPLLIATPAEEPTARVKQLIAEVIDDQSIQLNWVGEIDGEEKEIGYRVSYFPVQDQSAVVSVLTKDTTILIEELEAETDYQIEVSVMGEEHVSQALIVGTSSSLPIQISNPLPPQPTFLSVPQFESDLSSNHITLYWSVSSAEFVSGYELEYLVDGEFEALNQGTVANFSHAGLEPETSYTYRVRSTNTFGVSEFSDPISVTTFSSAPQELPKISISDVTGEEGTQGQRRRFEFEVTLSDVSGERVEVSFATRNGSAIAGEDYESQTGVLEFFPGEQAKAMVVRVIGDTDPENDENFFVDLSGASNAEIKKGTGEGTIENDDRDGSPGKLVVEGVDDRSVILSWASLAEQIGTSREYRIFVAPVEDRTQIRSVVSAESRVVIEELESDKEYQFQVVTEGGETVKLVGQRSVKTLVPGPGILSFVASDPDNGDAVFSVGDTFTITFSEPTDLGGVLIPEMLDQAEVDSLFEFTPLIDFDYEATWNEDGDQLTLSVTGGINEPSMIATEINSATVQIMGNLRNALQNSAPSRDSAVLEGNWGNVAPVVRIIRSNDDLVVSWEGGGTLQESPGIGEGFRDLPEADSPFKLRPSEKIRFYRVVR